MKVTDRNLDQEAADGLLGPPHSKLGRVALGIAPALARAAKSGGGDAPQAATNGRTRGSRRTASASRADPGGDEPHLAPRVCACGMCGYSVKDNPVGFDFFNGAHYDRARRYKQAEGWWSTATKMHSVLTP